MTARGAWMAAVLLGLAAGHGPAAQAPEPPPLRRGAALRMEVTAYCLDGTTAAGTEARRGVAAADPDVLPLGSRVRVTGLGPPHDGTYRIEDTGGAIDGRELDLFVRDCEAATAFGRRTATVEVLRVGVGGPTPPR